MSEMFVTIQDGKQVARIVPTHFIEVYNRKDKYKSLDIRYSRPINKPLLPIEYMKEENFVSSDPTIEALQTIAIFKIKLK